MSHPYCVHGTLPVLDTEITKMNKTWSLPWRNSDRWVRQLCKEITMIHFDKCCIWVIYPVLCDSTSVTLTGWRTLIIQCQVGERSLLMPHKGLYQFYVVQALFLKLTWRHQSYVGQIANDINLEDSYCIGCGSGTEKPLKPRKVMWKWKDKIE